MCHIAIRIAMSLPASDELVGSPLATLEREIASGCLPPDHALSKSLGMGLAYGILRRWRNLAVAEAFWLEKSSPGMLPSSPARVVAQCIRNVERLSGNSRKKQI